MEVVHRFPECINHSNTATKLSYGFCTDKTHTSTAGGDKVNVVSKVETVGSIDLAKILLTAVCHYLWLEVS